MTSACIDVQTISNTESAPQCALRDVFRHSAVRFSFGRLFSTSISGSATIMVFQFLSRLHSSVCCNQRRHLENRWCCSQLEATATLLHKDRTWKLASKLRTSSFLTLWLSLISMFQNCAALRCSLWLFRSCGKSFLPVPAGTRSKTRPRRLRAGF